MPYLFLSEKKSKDIHKGKHHKGDHLSVSSAHQFMFYLFYFYIHLLDCTIISCLIMLLGIPALFLCLLFLDGIGMYRSRKWIAMLYIGSFDLSCLCCFFPYFSTSQLLILYLEVSKSSKYSIRLSYFEIISCGLEVNSNIMKIVKMSGKYQIVFHSLPF